MYTANAVNTKPPLYRTHPALLRSPSDMNDMNTEPFLVRKGYKRTHKQNKNNKKELSLIHGKHKRT